MTTNRIVFIDSRVADSSVLLQGSPVETETYLINPIIYTQEDKNRA